MVYTGDAAPGASGSVLAESFDGSTLPAGWTVVDGFGDGTGWVLDDASDPAGCESLDPAAPMTGGWVAVDSDCA